MKTETLSTRIDHETKEAFSQICAEIGLSPSQAIKLFARAVINYRGIPFELKSSQPNATTQSAMRELIQNQGHKADNIQALIEELNHHDQLPA